MRPEAVVRKGVGRMRGLISLGVSDRETTGGLPRSLPEALTCPEFASRVREAGHGFRITKARDGFKIGPIHQGNLFDPRGEKETIAALVVIRDPKSEGPLGVTGEESLAYDRFVASPTRHKSAILVITRQSGEDIDELLLKRREEIAGESVRESERKRVVSNTQRLENQLTIVVALLEGYNVEFIQEVIKAGRKSKEAIVKFL